MKIRQKFEINSINRPSHVNRMDKVRKVYNILYNHPQGTRVRRRPKNRLMDCEAPSQTEKVKKNTVKYNAKL